jgi:hypothetical protein
MSDTAWCSNCKADAAARRCCWPSKLQVQHWDSDKLLPPGASPILESSDCCLEELGVLCCVDEPHEFIRIAHELAESLSHNSTLMSLSVSFLIGGSNDYDKGNYVGNWDIKAQFCVNIPMFYATPTLSSQLLTTTILSAQWH